MAEITVSIAMVEPVQSSPAALTRHQMESEELCEYGEMKELKKAFDERASGQSENLIKETTRDACICS